MKPVDRTVRGVHAVPRLSPQARQMLLGLSMCFCVTAFTSAHALSVSEPVLQSSLGQRLNVRVPLDGADLSGDMRVRLLPPSEYEHLELQAPDLYGLQLSAEIESEAGLYWVHLRSRVPVREPLLLLLIEVSSGSVRVIRELPLLLDTPAFDAPAETAIARAPPQFRPVSPTPLASSARIPELAQAAPPKPRPVASNRSVEARTFRPKQAVPDGEAAIYGPVRPGDTLWGIAGRLRSSPDANVGSAVAAIVAANPELAAHDGNLLQVGDYLRIPAVEGLDLARLSPAPREAAPVAVTAAPAPAPAPTPAAAAPSATKPALELGRIPEPMPVAAQLRMSDSMSRVQSLPIRLQPIADSQAAEPLVPSKALRLGDGAIATLQPLPEFSVSRNAMATRDDGGARWMNVAALVLSLLALAFSIFRGGASLR